MRISVIGTGYVGLVTGACLASVGRDVLCCDIDEEKIKKLRQCISPIYEDGLEHLMWPSIEEGLLQFNTSIKEAVTFSDIIFVCVGTPSREDGSVNLDYVKSVCDSINEHANTKKIVVMKSTVPVGTHKVLAEWLPGHAIVSNPEFLREGVAVNDFLKPDRIVIGLKRNIEVETIMQSVYEGIKGAIYFTDNASAEMTKYASNAMLAMRIAFINEIAQLCDETGANVLHVKEMVGADTRIGPKFLEPGPGYGGSCFPKDTRGLLQTFRDYRPEGRLVAATITANEYHKEYIVNKLQGKGVDFNMKKVAVLGLAFKPETDDTRDSPTHTIVPLLEKAGAVVAVHDPIAKPANENLGDVLFNADVVIVVTEWDCYKGLDAFTLRKLTGKNSVIGDARNIWNPEEMKEAGFTYYGMGR